MASKGKYDAAKAIRDNLPAAAGGGEPPDDYWEAQLERTEKGNRVIESLRNVAMILARDEHWAGVLAFDSFSNQVVKRKAPPYGGGSAGPWGDVDDLRTAIWLSHHYQFNPHKNLVMQGAVAVANDNSFHPVQEYFDELKWDGTPRAESWLIEYLGAAASDYARAAGLKFLLGAVARIKKPGCKMDNVLILEGPQGRWKSTALATLAGPWFGDTPFTIGDKDAYLVIRGTLIYELAELDGFSRAESSRGKAFFSSRYDTYVPKWVAWAIKVPRQCVFCGTVNHGTYLRDTTGNRRYWPVAIERADIDRLGSARDQIWAEAVHRFNQGARWWVQEEERHLFELEQELRYVGDAYEDVLQAFLLGKSETTMSQVLDEALKLEKSKWSRAEQTRVGEVLAKLGWEKIDRGSQARPRYVYVQRERQPGEEG